MFPYRKLHVIQPLIRLRMVMRACVSFWQTIHVALLKTTLTVQYFFNIKYASFKRKMKQMRIEGWRIPLRRREKYWIALWTSMHGDYVGYYRYMFKDKQSVGTN